MKKFAFSLETVRTFKSQILDNLQNELAIAVEQVRIQENEINKLKQTINDVNDEYNEKYKSGINVLQINYYKSYIRTLNHQLDKENNKLQDLLEFEEQKREEVVEAKKENMSLDMLKEKKLEEYNAMLRKDEELFIEEFVVNGLSLKK